MAIRHAPIVIGESVVEGIGFEIRTTTETGDDRDGDGGGHPAGVRTSFQPNWTETGKRTETGTTETGTEPVARQVIGLVVVPAQMGRRGASWEGKMFIERRRLW